VGASAPPPRTRPGSTSRCRPAPSTGEADVVHLVQREAGVQVDGVDCAGGLDPQVGDSVVCTVSGSGERLDVRVAVSSVDGGLVDYDLQPA
jgi:hypothetical protein